MLTLQILLPKQWRLLRIAHSLEHISQGIILIHLLFGLDRCNMRSRLYSLKSPRTLNCCFWLKIKLCILHVKQERDWNEPLF